MGPTDDGYRVNDDTSQVGERPGRPGDDGRRRGRRRRRQEAPAPVEIEPQEAPAAAASRSRRRKAGPGRTGSATGPTSGDGAEADAGIEPGAVPAPGAGPTGDGAQPADTVELALDLPRPAAEPAKDEVRRSIARTRQRPKPDATPASPVVTPAPQGGRRWPVRPVAAAVAVVLGLGVGGVLAIDDEAGPSLADYAAGQGGEVLVARDGGFQARFPTRPARRTQSVQVSGSSVPVVDYTGNAAGQTFTVSYAELPEGQEVGDPILRLNASATAAAEAVKGKLESAGITSFLGQPAVEYLIAVGGRYVKATSFLAGRRIYGIEVVGPVNPPAGYQRFRDTFELTS